MRAYAVATLDDGEDAVATLLEKEFDAVILDAVLAGMSGIDVLQQVRAAPRTVENDIAKLRQKIEPDVSSPVLVQTVRGEGYRFGATVE